MRKITKTAEPSSLTEWKKAYPAKLRYTSLSDDVRRSVRKHALQEQYYLCAYCCSLINSHDGNDCHNEHMEAQKLNPRRELDFSNIVASCNTRNQCGDSHGSQPLALLPVMDECETELQFMISGRVRGLSQRAIDAIKTLNLGDSESSNKGLVEKRKHLVRAIFFKVSIDPGEEIEDEEILEMLLEEIQAPQCGRLDSFAPVAANIIKNWIKN